MIEIIEHVDKFETIDLDEMDGYSLSSKILLSEKKSDPACQSVLSQERTNSFYWDNFYVKDSKRRTRYDSIREAVESRYKKGYRVFILRNKTELKDAINHR